MRRRKRFLESALCTTAPKSSTTACLPKAASARRLCCRQARGISNGNISPPLIDNLRSCSFIIVICISTTNDYICNRKVFSRDIMLFFIQSDLSGVRAMFTPVIMFMLCIMLICHASILYMLNLAHLFIMIYILVSIWKLPNYLTIPSSEIL